MDCVWGGGEAIVSATPKDRCFFGIEMRIVMFHPLWSDSSHHLSSVCQEHLAAQSSEGTKAGRLLAHGSHSQEINVLFHVRHFQRLIVATAFMDLPWGFLFCRREVENCVLNVKKTDHAVLKFVRVPRW